MRILYASAKETIELSCPPYLDFILKRIWKQIKVKTVELKKGNGETFSGVVIDEILLPTTNTK